MSNPEQAKREYDALAEGYNDFSQTPIGLLESQLIKMALGDLTGLTVLDLGGGSGLHAREAIDLGAVSVDIVDISPGMMKVAQDIEKSLGRNVMRFFEGDAAKPLSHLPLREEGYDVVMANWVFNFAESIEVLEAMFRNVTTYLKRGGRFVGVRDANINVDSAALPSTGINGKYGARLLWVKPLPGGERGYKYFVRLDSHVPVEFEGSSLEILNSGSPEVYEKAGLSDIEIVPYESAEVVRKDPEFWKEFLELPYMAVVKATKK
ncbi:S-adenosyl-L-methionine-dependent methyltransferase [Madurella fahalii]|uniref:S-adenosyl-L-methionine-dependent methyltransferase n=1 Tax=Madurella fahalii TaxID=1157608 RepID=A0ABQ0FYK4_9PEZI